ncbi:hypothetical protein GCM10027419_21610 [Pandoraea terrae]
MAIRPWLPGPITGDMDHAGHVHYGGAWPVSDPRPRTPGSIVSRLRWLIRWQGKIIGTIFIGLDPRVAMQQR